MKRLIGTVVLLAVLLSAVLPITVSASDTETEVENSLVATSCLSDFWINAWNDVSKEERSIVAYDRGLDTSSVNYGNFSVYKEIEVVDPEAYYANPTPAGFSFRKYVNLTPYEETGTLRFWINVPKNMSVKVRLKSYDGTKYSEASVTVDLEATTESEGYQVVEIPLKSFFNANKNWNAAYTRYILLGGVSNCDQTTFLDTDEILSVSPFEIWSDTPPEPVPYDATPVYRDINGKAFIKDINGVLGERSIIKAFNNSLEKASYESAVASHGEAMKLISLYTVSVIDSGYDKTTDTEEYGGSYDYSKGEISDYVELYLPITQEMEENYITVAALSGEEIIDCEFTLTDEYLIIKTNTISTIFIIDTNAPVFTADNMATSNVKNAVNDNTNFESAVFFKNAVGTGNSMIFNEYDIELTDITDWLKNENGELRFWIKAPYREGEFEFSLKLGLCARYYIYTESDGTQVKQAQYPQTVTVLPVSADGKWHEIRLASSVFSSTAFDKILSNEDYMASYDAFYIRVAANSAEYNISAAEGLYFTDFEFYKEGISYPVCDGNIDKIYTEIADLTSNPSWKYDENGYVTRTVESTSELPFFTKTVKFTASDTYTSENAAAISGVQQGIVFKDGVACSDFADWAYYNRGSTLRFWVKTSKATTFKVGLLSTGTGANPEISATVTCSGSEAWQEIRLKRSDFAYSSAFEDVILSNESNNVYLNFYVTEDTFVAGQSLEFGLRAEFFNDRAYDKGDITLDGKVDAIDLVRIKKFVAGVNSQTVNGDIDSNGAVNALDLAYVRNWLMSDGWIG